MPLLGFVFFSFFDFLPLPCLWLFCSGWLVGWLLLLLLLLLLLFSILDFRGSLSFSICLFGLALMMFTFFFCVVFLVLFLCLFGCVVCFFASFFFCLSSSVSCFSQLLTLLHKSSDREVQPTIYRSYPAIFPGRTSTISGHIFHSTGHR